MSATKGFELAYTLLKKTLSNTVTTPTAFKLEALWREGYTGLQLKDSSLQWLAVSRTDAIPKILELFSATMELDKYVRQSYCATDDITDGKINRGWLVLTLLQL